MNDYKPYKQLKQKQKANAWHLPEECVSVGQAE